LQLEGNNELRTFRVDEAAWHSQHGETNVEVNKVQKDCQVRQMMTHLVTGNQVFHNGVPVQLLYRTALFPTGETWRVRPLFVDEPDREEQFTCSDTFSFLHTRRATRAAMAA
jgi:hypothetical protein